MSAKNMTFMEKTVSINAMLYFPNFDYNLDFFYSINVLKLLFIMDIVSSICLQYLL